MRTEEKVQVIVEIDGFRDALYFTPAERAALTEGQIEDMARARYDAHVARLAAPPPEVAPLTEEQVEEEIAALTQQQRDTQERLRALAKPERLAEILLEQERIVGGMRAELVAGRGKG